MKADDYDARVFDALSPKSSENKLSPSRPSESKDPRKNQQKVHSFDLTPAELNELKALFPEFKEHRGRK